MAFLCGVCWFKGINAVWMVDDEGYGWKGDIIHSFSLLFLSPFNECQSRCFCTHTRPRWVYWWDHGWVWQDVSSERVGREGQAVVLATVTLILLRGQSKAFFSPSLAVACVWHCAFLHRDNWEKSLFFCVSFALGFCSGSPQHTASSLKIYLASALSKWNSKSIGPTLDQMDINVKQHRSKVGEKIDFRIFIQTRKKKGVKGAA